MTMTRLHLQSSTLKEGSENPTDFDADSNFGILKLPTRTLFSKWYVLLTPQFWLKNSNLLYSEHLHTIDVSY